MPRKKAGAAGKKSEFVTAFDQAVDVFRAIAKAVKTEGGDDADLLALLNHPEVATEIGRTIARRNLHTRPNLKPDDKLLRGMSEPELFLFATERLKLLGFSGGLAMSSLFIDPRTAGKMPHPNFPRLLREVVNQILLAQERVSQLPKDLGIRTKRGLPDEGYTDAKLEHAFTFVRETPLADVRGNRIMLWGSHFELKCPNDTNPLKFYFYMQLLAWGWEFGVDLCRPHDFAEFNLICRGPDQ